MNVIDCLSLAQYHTIEERPSLRLKRAAVNLQLMARNVSFLGHLSGAKLDLGARDTLVFDLDYAMTYPRTERSDLGNK